MLNQLSKATNDVNNENKKQERTIIPYVDIYENDDDFIIKAEMPGVNKDNVDVTVKDGELVIEGVVDKDERAVSYQEFEFSKFQRSFTVKDTIDAEKIKADLKNGVLTLTLPKNEKLKARKIQIVSEN